MFDADNWPFIDHHPHLTVDQWDALGGVTEDSFLTPGEGFAWTTKGRLISLTEMAVDAHFGDCLLYTSPSPRDRQKSRMPSSA